MTPVQTQLDDLNVVAVMMDKVQVFGRQSAAFRDKGGEAKEIKVSVILSQRRWNRNSVVVSAVGFPRTGIPFYVFTVPRGCGPLCDVGPA